MNNNWRLIPGLENYAINEDGVVKALPKIREGILNCLNNHAGTTIKSQRKYAEHIIKPKYTSRYWYVSLTHDGIKKYYRVHRLVYKTFVGDIPENMVIDHIDGNRNNNNVSNLRCVTQSENVCNQNTKYNQCKAVIQINPKTGEVLHEYLSIVDAMMSLGKEYKKGMSGHIGDCCNGKRKTAYGYYWIFK